MAIIEALVGGYLQKKEKEEKEAKTEIEYVINFLGNYLDKNKNDGVNDKIRELYKNDKNKFAELTKSVEMLGNILTAMPIWIRDEIKTENEIKKEIQEYKQEIENILGVNIKLVKQIEDFLAEED